MYMQFPVFQSRFLSVLLLHSKLPYVGIASLTLLTLLMGQMIPVGAQAPDGQTQNGGPAPAQPAVNPTPGNRPILRIGSEGEPVSELQAMLKLLGYYSGTVDGVYREDTAVAVATFQQAVGLQADGVVGPDTWNLLLPPSPPANVATPAPGTAPPAANSGGTSFPSPTVSPTPPVSSPSPSAPVASPTPSPTPEPSPSPTTPAPAPEATSPSPEEPAPEEQLSVDLPILRLGTRGPAVERLQDRLKALGFFDGPVDGIFGEATQAAVQAAQRNFDLEPDGVVGPATWSVLLQ